MPDDTNKNPLTPEQEFWANPHDMDLFPHAAPGWRDACKPDYYLKMEKASEFYAERLLQHVPTDSSILELGANCGRNLHFFREVGFKNVAGIELNKEAIRNAYLHYPDVAERLVQGTIQKLLPFWEQVDVIFTSVTLMHVPWHDDWVLDTIAKKARKVIMVTETENSSAPEGLKFARDYQVEFETKRGWKQVESKIGTGVAHIGACNMRIFYSEDVVFSL